MTLRKKIICCASSIGRINAAAIALMLSFLFVLPVVAQPTSFRDFKGSKRLIQDRIEEVAKITRQIENNKSNVLLYKKRLRFNAGLLVLSEDTNDWNAYADRQEADLSRVIELEKTAENYYRRGDFLTTRLNRLSVANFSDLYPSNRYVSRASSDFLKALLLTSKPEERQRYYTNLAILYSKRPQRLISASDLPKWKNVVSLKLIRRDFDLSINYSRLALKAAADLPYIKTLKQNLVATYLSNADVAVKLGDSTSALKFTQAAQKSR